MKKVSKKELAEHVKELEKKGARFFVKEKDGQYYPFCILCGKIIGDEPHFTGIWWHPDLKRNYIYATCLPCSPKLSEDDTTKEIEEKLMFIVTKGKHLKLKTGNK